MQSALMQIMCGAYGFSVKDAKEVNDQFSMSHSTIQIEQEEQKHETKCS
jgi:hypothetical protein